MSANFCFGTPVLFMRAWACVALSGWRVKNHCQDNTRKSLGPVVYKMRVPRAGKQLAGSPGYREHVYCFYFTVTDPLRIQP